MSATVGVTNHAVERFIQRFEPEMSFDASRREFAARLALCAAWRTQTRRRTTGAAGPGLRFGYCAVEPAVRLLRLRHTFVTVSPPGGRSAAPRRGGRRSGERMCQSRRPLGRPT